MTFLDIPFMAIAWLPLLKFLPSAMSAAKGLIDDDDSNDLQSAAQAAGGYSDYNSAQEDEALDKLMKERRMRGM